MPPDTLETLREQITTLREARAAHAVEINRISERIEEISNDVKAILVHVERAKGSWKMLVALAGGAGAFVEAIHYVVGLIQR